MVPDTVQLNGNKQHPKEKSLVSSELVRDLVDPAVAPSVKNVMDSSIFAGSREATQ